MNKMTDKYLLREWGEGVGIDEIFYTTSNLESILGDVTKYASQRKWKYVIMNLNFLQDAIKREKSFIEKEIKVGKI